MCVLAEKSDPPDYSVAGESPLGSCHRGGTFECWAGRTISSPLRPPNNVIIREREFEVKMGIGKKK